MDQEILRLIPGDQDLHTHSHTSKDVSWKQRYKVQADDGGNPRDCCVCSCAAAMARSQAMHCWAEPDAQGSIQTTQRALPLQQCKVGIQRGDTHGQGSTRGFQSL